MRWGWIAGGASVVGALLLLARRASSGGWAGTIRRAPAELPIIVMGDSIAVGTGQALRRLASEAEVGSGSKVAIEAVVGEGTGATERQIEQRLSRMPQARTIVLSTGTNSLGPDIEGLTRRIVDMIHGLRRRGYRVILIGPPPAMGARYPDAWKDQLHRLAVIETGMADFVDLWNVLGSEDNPGFYHPDLGAGDDLHPSSLGYTYIAANILEGG